MGSKQPGANIGTICARIVLVASIPHGCNQIVAVKLQIPFHYPKHRCRLAMGYPRPDIKCDHLGYIENIKGLGFQRVVVAVLQAAPAS